MADFGHERRFDSSFPSVHTARAWGVLTPLAQHYDAPWSYGVAAITNAGRVAGRDHWLSDTVACSLMGCWVGDRFGKHASAHRTETAASSFMLLPRGVLMSISFR